MTDSPRDLLLAVDSDAKPRLERIRTDVLDRELGSRWSVFGWGAFAAAWLLIALLKAATPAVTTADPRSAELARIQRLFSSDASPVLAGNFEPFGPPRIP